MQFSRSYLLLSAQLLVFLFVSSLIITSSNAYADDLGSTFIDQVITLSNSSNAITNNGYISAIYSTFNNNRSYFSPAETYFSQYDYFIVESLNQYDSSAGLEYYTRNMVLYFFNASDDVNFKIVNSYLSSTSSVDYRVIRFRNGSINSNSITSTNSLSLHLYQLVSNYDKEIKNDDGTVNSSINTAYNEGFVSSLGLYFIPRLSDISADVWAYEDVPVYQFSGDEDLYIGQLYVPISYTGYETNSNFFYMWGNWQYRDLTSRCTILDFVNADDGGSLFDVYLSKNYFYSNTLYYLVWTDTSTDPYSLAVAIFYLGDQNTVIIDGIIDPSKTFSGDYKDEYDYKNDPNQNFWKDTYNRLMTPSGEVLRGTITSLMSDLDFSASGDESGELMMALAGLDVISNDFGDFIISWNDFSPNLTIKGQTVSSSGPFIPAGQINFSQMERNNETFHDIMQYTRAILSFSVIALFFSNLWHTLLITLGISTQIYERDQLNKDKLNRQAERDQRRQEREDRQRYQQWLYEHRR